MPGTTAWDARPTLTTTTTTTEGYPRGEHQEEHQEHQEHQATQGREDPQRLIAAGDRAQAHLGTTEEHRLLRTVLREDLEDQETHPVPMKDQEARITNRQKKKATLATDHRHLHHHRHQRDPCLRDRQQRSDRGGSTERRQYQDGPPPQQIPLKSLAEDYRDHRLSYQLPPRAFPWTHRGKLRQSTTP